jgi:ornithine cyclodeaminase
VLFRSDLLSRTGAETLLVCGGGALAPHLIAAHCAVRPIKHVLWWNRRPETLDPAPLRAAGLPVEVTADLAAAASAADIVSTATRANAPIIEGGWLKPGCHLDLVGGYLPEMREADDAAFRRAARHYIDARLTTIGVAGDICAPLAASLTSEDALIDMFQLNRAERPGRQDDQEITWFKSGGGGHEDLAVAQYLYESHRGAN